MKLKLVVLAPRRKLQTVRPEHMAATSTQRGADPADPRRSLSLSFCFQQGLSLRGLISQ